MLLRHLRNNLLSYLEFRSKAETKLSFMHNPNFCPKLYLYNSSTLKEQMHYVFSFKSFVVITFVLLVFYTGNICWPLQCNLAT